MDKPVKTKIIGSILEVTIDRPKANAIDAKTSIILGGIFADFRDNAAFIDPTTMKVSQGKLVDKVVDGKTIRVMSDNTADFTQVSTMLGWMGQEIDKFDLTKAIDDTYKTLAPSYQTNMPDGSIKDDVRKMPGFQKAVNGKLKSYLNDPRNVASVLADYAQMAPKGGTDGTPAPWEFTDDVKKANKYA